PGRCRPVTPLASTPARNPTTIHDSQLMAAAYRAPRLGRPGRPPSRVDVHRYPPRSCFVSLVVDAPTKHEGLLSWVETMAELCEPDAVHWCDGSQAEYEHLCAGLVEAGTFVELDPERR